MSAQPSLADMAVQTLAAVASMDAEVTNEHPYRHQVRTLKRVAEALIGNALRSANELAYIAKDIQREHEEQATGSNT